MASKRKDLDESELNSKKIKSSREVCFFGKKCYRKRPDHFLEFSHPHLENLTEIPTEDSPQILRDQFNILQDLKLIPNISTISKQNQILKSAENDNQSPTDQGSTSSAFSENNSTNSEINDDDPPKVSHDMVSQNLFFKCVI